MCRELGFSYRKEDATGECVITAWEYATGVPRDDIAQCLGCRGGELLNRATSRQAGGERGRRHDHANLVGVDDWAAVRWAHSAGYETRLLVTEEHRRDVIIPQDLSAVEVEYTTQMVVQERLSGSVAVLYQTLAQAADRSIGHVVAWLGDCVIDPGISTFWVSTRIDGTITRFAVVIVNRDPEDAMRDLRDLSSRQA